MNEITERLVKDYVPQLAIVVYTTDNENWTDTYLESHVIKDGRIMAGKPLQQETIEAIVDVFFDERQNRAQVSGLIPGNLLHFDVLPGGQHKMIWYTPAQVKYMHFATGLHIPSGNAWVPAMLWYVDQKKLYLYALASDDRPTLDTHLYTAPFHNTAEAVCLGSAKVAKPDRTYAGIMKYWEDLFWLSEFTHGASNTKTNMNMIWKRLITDNGVKWSDLDELVLTKKTLKTLLK